MVAEPYLAGCFEKFNSNGGWECEERHQVMTAFTHWTWERTGHRYMLCDLQGVADPNRRVYLLTDPAVHSCSGEFQGGLTDLGTDGMLSCLAGHRCNQVCRMLQLPDIGVYKEKCAALAGRKEKRTVFAFEADNKTPALAYEKYCKEFNVFNG